MKKVFEKQGKDFHAAPIIQHVTAAKGAVRQDLWLIRAVSGTVRITT